MKGIDFLLVDINEKRKNTATIKNTEIRQNDHPSFKAKKKKNDEQN